ncbi:MAG TPA: sigma 54-interacting transcriptional regulator [bacterium]|nr:sigma 54-interacting transcriptional regulator [bacterium]
MGTLLGDRFEILKELGRGSRGIVYLASDRERGREVALKVFPFSHHPSGLADEFRNEFSILSRLHNPSLAEIYEIGFDPDGKSFFLAEEYFEGEPLSRWSGRLSFQRLAAIAAQVCQVLQFLHQQGIFHGDLKPSNILINEKAENGFKLVDFGLARRAIAVSEAPESEGAAGQPGTVSGTLPYMAPELFMGAPVDGRSDLYSLGATLYELVSGHPPFEGRDAPTLVEQHLFVMPMNPVPEGSAMPKEFGFLILRLLNKDPADRFEEANDVIRALNLQFHFNFPLGPEKPVLTPAQAEELQKKHVERLYEWAVRFYKDRDDAESRRLLAEIYHRQGNWDEAENLLQGLTGQRVQLLLLQIGLKKGRFEWVREEGTRLAQGPQASIDGAQRGLLLNTLGEALYYLGQYADSEEAFREALSSFEKFQDKASRASLLNNLGNLKIRDGKWEEAKAFYEESVALSRGRGDVLSEGLYLMSLGYAYHLKERYEEALSYYSQSEAILEAIGYRPGIAKVKSNLANLFIAAGSLEKGEEKLRQSEEIAIEKGDRFLIAYGRLLSGDLLKKKGSLPEALAAYREGKRLFHDLKSPHEESIAERNLAEMEDALKAAKEPAKEATPLEAAAPAPREKAEPAPPFLKRVLAINRRISLLQDVDEILEVIMDAMVELTGAERGFLILREGGQNVVKATRDAEPGAEGEHGSFSSSLVNRVLKTGEPAITIDAMTDERFSHSLSIHDLKLRSIVCIPFRVRDAVIGAVYLDNRHQRGAFTEADMELLQAFADQTAIAIANAWAFEELKKGALEIRKSQELLQRSKEEIEALNRQLESTLSEKVVELDRTQKSLAVKQAALELKYRYDEIIGRSPPIMEVLKLLDRVTDSDVSVFLHGESGTGKELIARAIHFNGPRRKGPFIPVNCSAIPETLLEAELFGYAKGAFTGAERDREGLFETANGGTLFLDEIGDMPLAMQAKLLRVLEDRHIRPLGSQKVVQVDVRILTASNRDLKDLAREKKFREDLFFRVHGVRITLPPLRARKEDFPLLVDHFLEKFAKDHKVAKKTLTPRAMDLLAAYPWPGNIRELESAIFNACLLCAGRSIGPEELRQKEELFGAGDGEDGGGQEAKDPESLSGMRAAFEKRTIRRALEESRGNISLAAKKLKVARPQLSRLVKAYGLKS